MQRKKELELPRRSDMLNEVELENIFGGEEKLFKNLYDWLKDVFNNKDNN